MSAAKAAGAKESEWLSYADPAVRGAEQTFKDSLKSQPIPSGWIRINPKPSHVTKGGPLGDVPQKAISHLSGCSLSAAKDHCLMAAIGLTPPAVSVDTEDGPDPESEESEAEEEVQEVNPPKQLSPKSVNSDNGGKTPTQKNSGQELKTPSPKAKVPNKPSSA